MWTSFKKTYKELWDYSPLITFCATGIFIITALLLSAVVAYSGIGILSLIGFTIG